MLAITVRMIEITIAPAISNPQPLKMQPIFFALLPRFPNYGGSGRSGLWRLEAQRPEDGMLLVQQRQQIGVLPDLPVQRAERRFA